MLAIDRCDIVSFADRSLRDKETVNRRKTSMLSGRVSLSGLSRGFSCGFKGENEPAKRR